MIGNYFSDTAYQEFIQLKWPVEEDYRIKIENMSAIDGLPFNKVCTDAYYCYVDREIV